MQQWPVRSQVKEGAQLLLPGITAFPTLLRPRSVGSVRLQSNNPADPPLIDPNVFDVDEDMEGMVEALHIVRKVDTGRMLLRLSSK